MDIPAAGGVSMMLGRTSGLPQRTIDTGLIGLLVHGGE
jgi:hypothetical protein